MRGMRRAHAISRHPSSQRQASRHFELGLLKETASSLTQAVPSGAPNGVEDAQVEVRGVAATDLHPSIHVHLGQGLNTNAEVENTQVFNGSIILILIKSYK